MSSFFAHRWALWLMFAVSALSILLWFAVRRRRTMLARLGNPYLAEMLSQVWHTGRRLRSLCWCLGLTVLAVAVAGPQWGRVWGGNALAQSGRDVVIVLDQSRSMLAEQPSRQRRAKEALRDLADAMQKRGGHRVALVVFAAKPMVVFPLTNDYDHLRHALTKQDADNLPPQLRPAPNEGILSGTRIGSALEAAVQLHDERFAGAQDILLLSDGDDPVADDEWLTGANAARQKKIPVHAIAIGDPDAPAELPHGDGVVQTSLREQPLKEIARLTGGVYFPAHTKSLPLGTLFRETIEPRGTRAESDVDSIAHLIVYRQRFGWFAFAAFLLMAMAMLIPESKRTAPRLRRFPMVNGLLAATALMLVSAAPVADFDESLSKGNSAFEKGDFTTAVQHYERAALRARDPGLVAFNIAAAFYHTKQYDAAMRFYERCLEDDSIPPLRKAKAWFNLGNCLLHQKEDGGKQILEHAQRCYESCLSIADIPNSLQRDARYNLELARLLWLSAKNRPPPPPQPKSKNGGSDPKPKDDEPKNGEIKPEKGNGDPSPAKKKDAKPSGVDKQFTDTKKKLAALPKLNSLPDRKTLTPMSERETQHFLEQAIMRIQRDHRLYRRAATPFSDEVKDW